MILDIDYSTNMVKYDKESKFDLTDFRKQCLDHYMRNVAKRTNTKSKENYLLSQIESLQGELSSIPVSFGIEDSTRENFSIVIEDLIGELEEFRDSLLKKRHDEKSMNTVNGSSLLVDPKKKIQFEYNKPKISQKAAVVLAHSLTKSTMILRDIDNKDVALAFYLLTGYSYNHFKNKISDNQVKEIEGIYKTEAKNLLNSLITIIDPSHNPND
jgi:hypothetical protein